MKKGLIVFLVLLFMSVGFCAFAQQNEFVGADKCKGCHPQQYKDFETRKFTKAWSVLQMRGKTKDPECLKCHVTGYGMPGGFTSEEATPHLRYKQCEACHGAGSVHAGNPGNLEAKRALKAYVSDKNVCIECHRCMKTHKSDDF